MALRNHSEFLPGTTYLESKPKGHLWVVLSDYRLDQDKVVVVNLSKWTPRKDQTCIVDPGEHPYVTVRSVAFYAGTRIVRRDTLILEELSNVIQIMAPASEALIEKMRRGTWTSNFVPQDATLILAAQKLI